MERLSTADKIVNGCFYIILILAAILTLYPFWNTLVISLNNAGDTSRGGLTLWPRMFTLDNYGIVFQNPHISRSFVITILRTSIGTVLSIMATAIFGFGMSRRGIVGKKFYMTMCLITMYFSGGLIPFYLLMMDMNMNNTFWILVIPGMINVFYMIIFRAFFLGIPESLIESAKIDGYNHIQIFFTIILPVSGSVIAALSLFTAVGLWNEWFTASIFISRRELMPIQSLLNQITAINTAQEMLSSLSPAAVEELRKRASVSSRSLMATTMMVVTIPIIVVYPFLQKYFVKGVLIGSMKE